MEEEQPRPQPDGAWERYGRTLTQAMAEVLEEIPEEARPHLLETEETLDQQSSADQQHQRERHLTNQ